MWKNGIWLTRLAIALGIVTIGVGLVNARLYQINIFAFLAASSIILSIAGIGCSFWRISLRSRRWRDRRFWISLGCDVVIIAAVGFLFHRGLAMEPYQNRDAPGLSGGPMGQ
jgi:predicted membrane protein